MQQRINPQYSQPITYRVPQYYQPTPVAQPYQQSGYISQRNNNYVQQQYQVRATPQALRSLPMTTTTNQISKQGIKVEQQQNEDQNSLTIQQLQDYKPNDDIYEICFIMAETSYHRFDTPKKPARETYQARLDQYALQTKNAEGFKVIKAGDDQFFAVCHESQTIVLAEAGTRLDRHNILGDLFNDILIFGFGVAFPRSNQSKEFFEKLLAYQKKNNLQHYKILCTGHSLGGNVIMNLHKEFHKDIQYSLTFNAGASIANLIYKGKKDNIIAYHCSYDPISVIPIAKTEIEIQSANVASAHGLNNFRPKSYKIFTPEVWGKSQNHNNQFAENNKNIRYSGIYCLREDNGVIQDFARSTDPHAVRPQDLMHALNFIYDIKCFNKPLIYTDNPQNNPFVFQKIVTNALVKIQRLMSPQLTQQIKQNLYQIYLTIGNIDYQHFDYISEENEDNYFGLIINDVDIVLQIADNQGNIMQDSNNEAVQFTEQITRDFSNLCYQHNELSELKQIIKSVILAQWMFSKSIEINFNFLQDQLHKHLRQQGSFEKPNFNFTVNLNTSIDQLSYQDYDLSEYKFDQYSEPILDGYYNANCQLDGCRNNMSFKEVKASIVRYNQGYQRQQLLCAQCMELKCCVCKNIIKDDKFVRFNQNQIKKVIQNSQIHQGDKLFKQKDLCIHFDCMECKNCGEEVLKDNLVFRNGIYHQTCKEESKGWWSIF